MLRTRSEICRPGGSLTRPRPASARWTLPFLILAVLLASASPVVAQHSPDQFHDPFARPDSLGTGWPVPFLSRSHDRQHESGGTFAPIIRAESDPLDVFQFPVLTDAAEIDLVSFPWIRLPSLGLPRFFGRVRGEYADDFDTQSRIGGSAHLRTSPVFGFDLEWNYRREDLARSRHDKLWTGDANVVYQLVNVQMVSMRAGAGIAWLADDDEEQVGFNATYGADFWIRQPWLMTLELDFGRISGQSLTHARGTIGYVWGQIELYTGWDWFELDDTEFDGVIGGVTLWF